MKTGRNWFDHWNRATSVKASIRFVFISGIVFALSFLHCTSERREAPDVIGEAVGDLWKAGVASSVITPLENIWMSGYAARETPAQGKIHDLWVKALALEDTNGKRAIFITCDIVGFSRNLSTAISRRIQNEHQIDRSSIVLSSSHNHSGPVVNENLFQIYPPFSDEMRAAIENYIQWLENEVVKCAGSAFEQLEIATLSAGVGMARFAVNRRNNVDSEVLNSPDLVGPVDHTVPVIKVSRADGTLKSLLVGYACHATTLDECRWSGDYPGFAQLELEAAFPGSTAMFFAGCGGDQNPIPRRSVPLASQYGEELASAVKRVLKEPMKNLGPNLATNYNEIELAFSEPLAIDSLEVIAQNGPPYQTRWANTLIERIRDGKSLPQSYPHYPVQSWLIGDQKLLMLGGEVVVDYALRLRQNWGNDLIIAAYTNDVMAYIPSERVLYEGGYEGNTSMRAYGQPSTWAPGIEETIVAEVARQLQLLD